MTHRRSIPSTESGARRTGSNRPARLCTARPLTGTLMACAAVSLLSAGCGQGEEPLVHEQGGAFAPLGFGEAQLASDGTPSYLSGKMAGQQSSRITSAEGAVALLTKGALAMSYRLVAETSLSVVLDQTDELGNRYIKLQ